MRAETQFIGTSVGMVSATIRPPAAAAADEADSWCSIRLPPACRP